MSRGATGRADETATEPRLGPRFGPEAGLILAAAAFAALLELSWPGVIAVVLCAWLAVAVFEIVRARVRPAAAEEPPSPPTQSQPDTSSEPAEHERFAAPPSARLGPRAEPELAGEPEPEPTRAAECLPEPPQQQAASLVAAPEQVEPTPPPEQDGRS